MTAAVSLELYAVIHSGGKQYRVREGQVLELEKLECEPGDSIKFDQVSMVAAGDGAAQLGAPFLKGCVVTAEVVAQGRAKKVKILKMKRRKHHMKRMGHRQWYTQVKITGIQAA